MKMGTVQPRIELSVQWHITTDCTNRCRHCYMFDPRTYEAERANELDRTGLFAVLERFVEFERDWPAEFPHFAISGGDPLLCPEWEELVTELTSRGKSVSMMGNPETLTPANLAALKRSGVRRYQLSLDGLEPTHDAIRSPGSFRRTVEGFARLADIGLRCNAMMTVSPENASELIPLLEYVVRHTRATSFGFDLASPVGNAGGISGRLTPERLLDLFRQYRRAVRQLKEEGFSFRVAEKPALFRVLSAGEAGREIFQPAGTSAVGGCLIGWNGICILSDGRMMACRRFPSVVGKFPEQTFAEVFLGSPELRRFRRASQYPECGTCRFFGICRGCPAVNFGLTGVPRGPYPLCFKPLLENADEGASSAVAPRPELPLDASWEEEFELVAGHITHLAAARLPGNLKNPEYRKALLIFTLEGEKEQFLANPERWLAGNRIRLGDLECLCALILSRHHFLGARLGEAEYEPCFP